MSRRRVGDTRSPRAGTVLLGVIGLAFLVIFFGWPLLAAGGLKIAYDLLLLAYFGKVRPPEEAAPHPRPENDPRPGT